MKEEKNTLFQSSSTHQLTFQQMLLLERWVFDWDTFDGHVAEDNTSHQ